MVNLSFSSLVIFFPVSYVFLMMLHLTVKPDLVVVVSMSCFTVSTLFRMTPFNFRVICGNNLCSIGFHFEQAGLTVRTDKHGASSIVRGLGLDGVFYDNLLDCFHSSAIKLNALTVLWTKTVLRLLSRFVSQNYAF